MLYLTGADGGKISVAELVSEFSEEQRNKFTEGRDLKKIARVFVDADLTKTLQSLFENDLNVSLTARRLYMHRNTLIYRLHKIKKLTGLDPRVFRDAVTLMFLGAICGA